jgi:hypothetical protein
MAHIIYQTEGIVLGKKDFGEAERMYNIYTEKFGMIQAMAQGVRYLKSKLKYNLDLFTFGNFSLIAGRDFWRITDAEEIKSNKKNIRIANFLMRMIRGEEKNDFIWQKIKKFFLSGGDEIETMAEILHNLGYMAEVPESKKKRIAAINRAIKESML